MPESPNPSHYKRDGIECIDAIRAALGKEGFTAYLRGTIMKYLWRTGLKDDPAMEAAKVCVYAGWLKEHLEGKAELTKPASAAPFHPGSAAPGFAWIQDEHGNWCHVIKGIAEHLAGKAVGK